MIQKASSFSDVPRGSGRRARYLEAFSIHDFQSHDPAQDRSVSLRLSRFETACQAASLASPAPTPLRDHHDPLITITSLDCTYTHSRLTTTCLLHLQPIRPASTIEKPSPSEPDVVSPFLAVHGSIFRPPPTMLLGTRTRHLDSS